VQVISVWTVKTKLVELDLESCLLELRTEARFFESTNSTSLPGKAPAWNSSCEIDELGSLHFPPIQKYRGLYFSDMLHSVQTERVAKSKYNSIRRARLFVDNCSAISSRNFLIGTKQ
jgi:hypothetical protein